MANIRFRTAEVSLKLLERLFRMKIDVDGLEHLNGHPTVFVINHFTRLETILLPYVLYKYQFNQVKSLAHHGLFHGVLGNMLSSLGVVSTRAPNRDNRIIGDLMCDRHDWLIYPEGRMVKNKKVYNKAGFFASKQFKRSLPRTGAAILALKSEIYKRRYRAALDSGDNDTIAHMNQIFGIERTDAICPRGTVIVPVTISFYPIRPGGNIINRVMRKLMNGISDRLDEEIEIEGNLILKKSDINIYFGTPIAAEDFLAPYTFVSNRLLPFLKPIERTNILLKMIGKHMTKRFMNRVYNNIEINIDHIFCAGLYATRNDRLHLDCFQKALYLTAQSLRQKKNHRLHESLVSEDMLNLLTNRPFPPLDKVRTLARKLGILNENGTELMVDRRCLDDRHELHSIRQRNPIRVIANELEPLRDVMRTLRYYVNLDRNAIRKRLATTLALRDRELFLDQYRTYYAPGISKPKDVGSPFILRADSAHIGVVLSHGLLAAPAEIRPLADFLHAAGISVYGIRLEGHGTSPENLRDVTWRQWVESFMRGYGVLRNSCDHVLLGGFSAGGLLALLAASEYEADIAGVFCINSPENLRSIRASRAVPVHWWNRFMSRFGDASRNEAVQSQPENPDINYNKIYIRALIELKKLMDVCRRRIRHIHIPALVIHARHDPVVNPASAIRIYSRIRSSDKLLEFVDFDRHVIVRREGSEKIFETVKTFILSSTATLATARLPA